METAHTMCISITSRKDTFSNLFWKVFYLRIWDSNYRCAEESFLVSVDFFSEWSRVGLPSCRVIDVSYQTNIMPFHFSSQTVDFLLVLSDIEWIIQISSYPNNFFNPICANNDQFYIEFVSFNVFIGIYIKSYCRIHIFYLFQQKKVNQK